MNSLYSDEQEWCWERRDKNSYFNQWHFKNCTRSQHECPGEASLQGAVMMFILWRWGSVSSVTEDEVPVSSRQHGEQLLLQPQQRDTRRPCSIFRAKAQKRFLLPFQLCPSFIVFLSFMFLWLPLRLLRAKSFQRDILWKIQRTEAFLQKLYKLRAETEL